MSRTAPLSMLPLFGGAPAPETHKATTVLDRMADERRAWLKRMRGELAKVYRIRVEAWGAERACVTADDARLLMAGRRSLALPAGASTNLLGALFRTGEWQAIDREHVSGTAGSHGNILTRWRYVGGPGSAVS